VIQDDVRRWDYKHQVLSTRYLAPWRVILWVKAIEALVQLRPKAIWRTFFQPDRRLRHGMRWYAQMGRRVWFFELRNFLFRDRRLSRGPSLEQFWGAPQDAEERSMQVASPRPTLRLDLSGRPGASGLSAAERHSAI
jgi:anaerobic magnesium-protoporphyrin IX monomethyl ester cyclase